MSNVDEAAARLQQAAAEKVPTPPVRDLIGKDDEATAYAVQAKISAARIAAGAVVTGRKIGLTSLAVQRQLGVDRPDFGVLFDDMQYADGQEIPADAVMQPRAEAEVFFVLGKDLAEGDLDLDQIRDAIDYAVAGIEVAGSRVAGWDITFGDTVADNASGGVYVLGADRRTLAEFEPKEVTMTMTKNGDVVSEGTGVACLGDPLIAVQWLAQKAVEVGDPLRAGQVILSGALGPMVGASAGDRFTAEISGLGSVTAVFAD